MARGTAHVMDARRLSVREAAPVLGVSVYMVRALIRQRRVPFYHIGRRIVLDREDLEQFLRAHRVEARAITLAPPRGTRTPRADARAARPGVEEGAPQ
jgi:excisionase family DNA binding protein